VLYNGTTVLYNGTTVLYNGTTVLYNGTTALYNGITVLFNAITVFYNGTTVLYNGTTVLYNGTTLLYRTGRHTHCCCITMSFQLLLDRCWFSVSPSGRFISGTPSVIGPESADGIATGYRLGCPGIESRCLLDFSHRPDRP